MRRSDPFLAKMLNNTYSKTNDGESVLGERGVRSFFLLLSGGKVKYFSQKAKDGRVARMQG